MRPWQLFNGLCKQQCCSCPLMNTFMDVPCRYEADGGELAMCPERQRPRLHDVWKLSFSFSRFHSDRLPDIWKLGAHITQHSTRLLQMYSRA